MTSVAPWSCAQGREVGFYFYLGRCPVKPDATDEKSFPQAKVHRLYFAGSRREQKAFLRKGIIHKLLIFIGKSSDLKTVDGQLS